MNEEYQDYRNTLSPIELLYDDRAELEFEIAERQLLNWDTDKLTDQLKGVCVLIKQMEEAGDGCKHSVLVEEWTGSMWYDHEFGPCDNLDTIVVCGDCGKEFTDEELQRRQHGKDL